MEKEKNTVFVSFATQKGGVGKSTFTIYAASWLHYVKGLNVAVVDCDYPQHSIMKQKKLSTFVAGRAQFVLGRERRTILQTYNPAQPDFNMR